MGRIMSSGSIVRVSPRSEWPDGIVWIEGMTTEADAAAWPPDDLLVLTSSSTASGALVSLHQGARGAMLPLAVLAVVVPREHRWDLADTPAESAAFARWYARLTPPPEAS